MKNSNLNKKYAIFIVGERDSGKSTLIRSLTGYRKCLWRAKSLSNIHDFCTCELKIGLV